jgi:hypothetical protein
MLVSRRRPHCGEKLMGEYTVMVVELEGKKDMCAKNVIKSVGQKNYQMGYYVGDVDKKFDFFLYV